jgi:hypothetical protein
MYTLYSSLGRFYSQGDHIIGGIAFKVNRNFQFSALHFEPLKILVVLNNNLDLAWARPGHYFPNAQRVFKFTAKSPDVLNVCPCDWTRPNIVIISHQN